MASFTWTAPPGPIIAYRFEVGTAAGVADIVTITLPPTPAFDRAGVPPGEYYVRVRAVNAAGVGPASRDVLLRAS